MSRLRRLHINFDKSLHPIYHHVNLPTHPQIGSDQAKQDDETNALLFLQPRDLSPRAMMVKVDTQAVVVGHSVFDLPGRRFIVPPWRAISVWSAILIFIGLTIAGFILAYQARKEFRMRVEEQRKLLETQANDDQAQTSISRKELQSFTRKSIMVLNSSPQKYQSPYRISVAGHLTPRNVFDRPSRDSILVAQITPQSDSFSHDDSYYQFSRQVARESFWDPAIRKSIMSVVNFSSIMPKSRGSVGFAMIEQLGEQAFEEDMPKRQHRPPQDPSLRVQGHKQVDGQRFVPTVPNRASQSVTFADSIDPFNPFPRRIPPKVTLNDTHKTEEPPPAPELSPPAILSADEALAQYAASRPTTPAPSHAHPLRSNSFLRRVGWSLTPQSSALSSSTASDPLISRNEGDIAVMQPMNACNGDSSTASMSGMCMVNVDPRLQPFAPTHPVIGEEETDYFGSRQLRTSTNARNSGATPAQPANMSFPRRLFRTTSNESINIPPTSTSVTPRPKLKISPVSNLSTCQELASPLSLSNSTPPVSSSYTRRKNKIELPASPRDGMSSSGSATATFTSFLSLMPNSTPPSSIDSHGESRPTNKELSFHRPESNSPPLTLKRLPSLSTNPHGRSRKQKNSQPSPREEVHMVRLKNRQDHLKRNHSTPTQAPHSQQLSSSAGHLSTRSSPVRRAVSTQARIPLGGTMSSGGVRDSSFTP